MQSFDEFLEFQKDLNGKRAVPAAVEKRAIVIRAAVAAENLLGDEKWDRYLELLQGAVKEIDGLKGLWEERLKDPYLVDHETILQVKAALTDLAAQHRTLKWAIELPRALMLSAAEFRKYPQAVPAPMVVAE